MSNKVFSTAAEFYAYAQRRLEDKYEAERRYTLGAYYTNEPVLGEDGEPVMEAYTNWEGAPDTRPATVSVTRYDLHVSGTGSRSYYRDSIRLPREVGDALAKVWKRRGGNTYARDNFVGANGMKKILTLLDANLAADIVERAKAAKAEREAREEKMKRNNQRRNIIAACAELLSAMDGSPDIARDVYAGAAYRAVMDYASHVLNDREA